MTPFNPPHPTSIGEGLASTMQFNRNKQERNNGLDWVSTKVLLQRPKLA